MTIKASAICLLNGNRAPEHHDFRNRSLFRNGWMTEDVRSWGSLPACLGTEMFQFGLPGWERCFEYEGVIVLAHQGQSAIFEIVDELKRKGRKVFVGLPEHFYEFLSYPMKGYGLDLLKFFDAVKRCDGQWNVIPQAEHVFRAFHNRPIINCLHAIAFDEWDHGLSVPFDKREGILVATRTLSMTPPRSTLIALAIASEAAKRLGTFVSYLSDDDLEGVFKGNNFVHELNFSNVRTYSGHRDSYQLWLQIAASHRLMVHFDMAGTLGRVAMDAALLGILCVGGNTDVNRALGTDISDLKQFTADYLVKAYYTDPAPAIARLREVASFSAVREQIVRAFNS